jgi:S-adenosylmethionine/arginine decarboxylase-like enzyme
MHKHLVITALVGQTPRDPGVVEDFLTELVKLVDMEIFMPAKAKYCDDPHNSGVTGVVVITTSHASIHIWDNVPGNPYPGMLQMDLYSCKDFEILNVLKFVEDYFGANIVSYQIIDRGLPSSAISVAA